MRRAHALSLFCLVAAIPGAAASAQQPDAAHVRAAVGQVMAGKGIGAADAPGCAVNVTAADILLHAAGYGSADLEHGVPFGAQTVSESGSVAKQFMAASILMLAEQGLLSLDDDIRTYLPEMPDYGTTIRIRDLIHQTSGIREWSTLAALRGYPRFYRRIHTNADLLRLVSSQRSLNFEPGRRFEYSNSNYGLLTVILERVSGLSAQQFGHQFIFGPLGMHATRWRDDPRAIVPDRAIAYRRNASGFEQGMPTESVYGHGALLTTVEDLQRWARALMSGVLSPFVTRELTSPGRLANGQERSYGGGLRLARHQGREVYRHGGVTAGYTAQLWAFPESRVSIALLCNISPGNTEDMAARIADAVFGAEPGPPEPAPPGAAATSTGPNAIPAGITPSYFVSGSGAVMAVKTAGDRRFVNLFTRPGFMELMPSPASADFIVHRDGYGRTQFNFERANEVTVSMDGREPLMFVRAAHAAPSMSIVGRYRNADLRVVYEVRSTDAGHWMGLVDEDADDPLEFLLEWLNADTYIAHVKTRSGYLRDDFVATFSPATAGGPATLRLSSVAGLLGVDQLEFTRD